MSRLDRQNFLGPDSDNRLNATTIGLVGVGGGGSHLAQQAAHLGIGGYVIIDPDEIDFTNTNRLIGGTLADLKGAEGPKAKIAIAERQIRALEPQARITTIKNSWHNATTYLRTCDAVIGGVDSFNEREQLERFCRRNLIPYIDIGMDVHELEKKQFLIGGQVILSMPGRPCMRCCGYITDDRLKLEAGKYGAAGSRPQVVWSNGVLASTAVGILVQLITPWFANPADFVYLDYDGNRGTVTPSPQMKLLQGKTCIHHPLDEVGDPFFDIRQFTKACNELATAKHVPPKAEAKATTWFSRARDRIQKLFSPQH